MRYLDPKTDLTFKRIFGEHPHLLKSFINSILPLDSPIDTLTYLSPELVPRTEDSKNSIVDVRCTDETGRQFIVEMQMLWTLNFQKRVVFNAAKAYFKQLKVGEDFDNLDSVYSLCIINQNFDDDLDKYQHHYKIIEIDKPNKVIDAMEFLFIELPKFKAINLTEKKLGVLWLRFLSETRDSQEQIPAEFLDIPEIKEATELLEVRGFNEAQLETYDKYWDNVSIVKTIYSDAKKEGKIEEKIEVVKSAIEMGLSTEAIMKLTGLTAKEIDRIIVND